MGISTELEEAQNDGEKAAMAADTAARVSSSREIESGRGIEKRMRRQAIAGTFSSRPEVGGVHLHGGRSTATATTRSSLRTEEEDKREFCP